MYVCMYVCTYVYIHAERIILNCLYVYIGWMCDALERKCTTEVMRKFTNTLGMVVPAMCYFLLSALPSHWVNEQVSLILITCGVSFGGMYIYMYACI